MATHIQFKDKARDEAFKKEWAKFEEIIYG